ncbi:uncharacterized protein PHALS_07890 [Plasmopara halstedii]|uniref:Uncharacterized protein n=1 Tax=Plasmopara halstedii TaxID=4781 RepID=A0A0P1B730_PLAHL|nr:uncharacterized protein PHALS_07890 [Plasmopara halstedii]CEG50165.1 hypothetical protein PHALS_07890 [Plasmopara halstedii]|eukprot:XP_024586534.1 hypothetical protein PHALS_07890 [Plasmopara halstedii]
MSKGLSKHILGPTVNRLILDYISAPPGKAERTRLLDTDVRPAFTVNGHQLYTYIDCSTGSRVAKQHTTIARSSQAANGS